MDIVPTEDDADYVQCPKIGVVIREDCGFGHVRLRSVCEDHGLDLFAAVVASAEPGEV
jgi:hypothetical protein